MNSELKPCPFCGGEPKVIEDISFSWVACDNSDCAVYARTLLKKTREEAIDAWNTRAERTCKPETEVLETVDIGIGLLERLVDNCSDCGEPLTCDYSSNVPLRRVLPNYCPNCGAKVVDDDD